MPSSEKKPETAPNPVAAKRMSHVLVLSLYSAALIILIVIGVLAHRFMDIYRQAVKEAPPLSVLDTPYLGTPSTILDAEGNVLLTLGAENIFREPIDTQALDRRICDAFVYTVDPKFYSSKGSTVTEFASSFFSVLLNRKLKPDLSITGQLAEGLLMSSSTHTRREDRLFDLMQLEHLKLKLEKELPEQVILSAFLNNVYLGNNCFGVQAASYYYYGKPASSLTFPEALVLAAISVDPSRNNPYSDEAANRSRIENTLSVMVSSSAISRDEAAAVLNEPVYDSLCRTNAWQANQRFSSFTREVFRQVAEELQEQMGYSPMKSYRLLVSGGLEIISCMDQSLQNIVDNRVNSPEEYVESGAGFVLLYSLSVLSPEGETSVYNEKDLAAYLEQDPSNMIFTDTEEMNQLVKDFRESVLSGGSIIQESFQPVPQPECAVIMIDHQTGQVKAISGGRGLDNSAVNSSRATDIYALPGSLLPVLSVFAPAIDSSNATLATRFYDAPYTVSDQPVLNWWGTQYLGYSNIRQAITYSMNVVAAKCLNSLVTPAVAFDYLENFGLTSIQDADRSSSLATGILKSGTTLEQISAAYAAIAGGGVYHRPVYYTRVLDQQGRLLIGTASSGTRILKSTTASLLTDAMTDVISSDKGFFDSYGLDPTGKDCRIEGYSLAGKTGQSIDTADAWFVGYNADITCGVWYGFDANRRQPVSLSGQKPLWRGIMSDYLAGQENKGFLGLADLVPVAICSKSGQLYRQGFCDEAGGNAAVYTELFAPGTEPDDFCDMHYALNICSESGKIATENCPADSVQRKIFLRINDAYLQYGYTTDYELFSPSDLGICDIHTKKK